MNNIKFKPWIGDNFAAAPYGKRILVLGDSHYEWNGSGKIDEWTDITTTLVNEQLDGDYTKRFWTNIVVMFLNRKPTLPEKRTFWHSIAFYNYLQSSAGFGPNSIPSNEQWESSASAFFEVLSTLVPQLLVCLGKRLWSHLPRAQRQPGTPVPGFDNVSTLRFTYPGGGCLAVQFPHPSRAFDGRKWHSCVTNAINVA